MRFLFLFSVFYLFCLNISILFVCFYFDYHKLSEPSKASLNPYIYEISNAGSSKYEIQEKPSVNITALSTGGTKIMIMGEGFSRVSALGNKVLIDENIECQIITYYTTPNQIQCLIPSCTHDKLRVPLPIKVIVDNERNSSFLGLEMKIVYVCKHFFIYF